MLPLTASNPHHRLTFHHLLSPPPELQVGSWDDVSGESFLRGMLSLPIEEATFKTGRDSLFNKVQSMGVDPRK